MFGVQFLQNGQTYNAYASKEVIVSCGSVNTPQLLMLSGIGPAEELRKHNIKVIADLPVGKNMLDHIMFYVLRYRLVYSTYYYNNIFRLMAKFDAVDRREKTRPY